jgi:hypothetical protein
MNVHDCRMESDMVHMFISTHSFPFDKVFSEVASNQDVYAQSARYKPLSRMTLNSLYVYNSPLVSHAVGGGVATCFMYGQTGNETNQHQHIAVMSAVVS